MEHIKIGLSVTDLDLIMAKFINYDSPPNPEKFRKAVSEAIEANNAKLLEDIRKLVGS